MSATWDTFAPAYDEAVTPFSTRIAEDALRIAGVQKGMRLLDIAAGGGALSIPAARLGADVLAVDFSTVMMERLQQKAAEQNLSNLQTLVMDGMALELEDNSFDVACSQLGIMLFPDRSKGLREMARVTKPGGKGVMVVFGPFEQVEFMALFFQALSGAVPDFTLPQNLPLFSYQNTDDLKKEMEEAGFRDVRVETVRHTLEVASGDHLWDMLQSSAPPIAGMLQQLSPEEQKSARDKLRELIGSRFGEKPAGLSGAFHVGTGVK